MDGHLKWWEHWEAIPRGARSQTRPAARNLKTARENALQSGSGFWKRLIPWPPPPPSLAHLSVSIPSTKSEADYFQTQIAINQVKVAMINQWGQQFTVQWWILWKLKYSYVLYSFVQCARSIEGIIKQQPHEQHITKPSVRRPHPSDSAVNPVSAPMAL